MKLDFETKAKGRFRADVINPDGSVAHSTDWAPNLILDSGLDYLATKLWWEMLNYAVVGTGTTPTKDVTFSEASQSGTTVTRTTGAYNFIVSDVGKQIYWADGTEAKITAWISSTQVTVGGAKTVAAQAFDLYRVNQTGLIAEVQRTNNYLAGSRTSLADESGKITYRSTYDFPVETAGVNYTEAGVSHLSAAGANIFSRFLFSGAVSVASGQQLRLIYQLVLDLGGMHAITTVDFGPAFTGWPVSYTITDITSNTTSFDVTLHRDHHYSVGEKLVISDAIPKKIVISAGTSTAADFTVTVPGHTYIAGDSIVIAGCTPSAYNGTWTVASVAVDEVTITSAANPGAMTVFGISRLATPASDWYNGEWTISAVPSSAVVSFTSTINPIQAGEGNAVGRLIADHHYAEKAVVRPFGGSISSSNGTLAFLEPSQPNISAVLTRDNAGDTYKGLPVWDGVDSLGASPTTYTYNNSTGVASSIGGAPADIAGPTNNSTAAYVAGSFQRVTTVNFSPSNGNNLKWQYLIIGSYYVSSSSYVIGGVYFIKFTDRQRKDNTHLLSVTITRKFGRQLS